MKSLVFALAIVAALGGEPVHSQMRPDGYAMLDSSFAKGAAATLEARETIARAKLALKREPGPMPVVHTEGTLPGKGIREASNEARKDLIAAQDLAFAWRLTGDRRYLNHAARILDAWLTVYRISYNPIDETWFDRLLFTTDLVENDIPPALAKRLDAFWRTMAAGYLEAMQAKRKMPNNWQSHRAKLATMAAFQVGDRALIARVREAFQVQIAANIRPDGSVEDFYERDALHYVTYDLDPLLMAAITARAHGEDWYGWASPTGSSLRGAVAWLLPFAKGEKTHIEFQNSKVKFDRERAAAGQKEYAPHPWNPAKAVDTFALAAICDPALAPFARALAAKTGRPPLYWSALRGARR